ncbi:type II toxin-antitoxin system HicB family antitoxin [Pseudorhodobacter wandonensis]|jgi:predicted HicB family RNase H-like nuclease|uniref:type II toxin-antitoxin system HicB family antitoxin n=1 Tax=Pseudorhodobacter wandonensis TaxID=1120568 RepID=UPI0009E64FAD|nr:type II toxin-antitoxin system HicB family antitoxin [Pseudorhodobacter wandonensis]
MKHMQYKGQFGSAEVSVEDGVVFGKLLFIRDLITYESESPSGLQAAFEAAVDEYLADCVEEGREADRPLKGQFNVRVAPSLHRSLAIAASQCDKSLNDYVETILSCHEHIDSNGNVKQSKAEITVLLQGSNEPAIFMSAVGTKKHLGSRLSDAHIGGATGQRDTSKSIWNVSAVPRVQ